MSAKLFTQGTLNFKQFFLTNSSSFVGISSNHFGLLYGSVDDFLNSLNHTSAGAIRTNLPFADAAVKEGKIPNKLTIQTTFDEELDALLSFEVPSSLQDPSEGVMMEFDPKTSSGTFLTGDFLF